MKTNNIKEAIQSILLCIFLLSCNHQIQKESDTIQEVRFTQIPWKKIPLATELRNSDSITLEPKTHPEKVSWKYIQKKNNSVKVRFNFTSKLSHSSFKNISPLKNHIRFQKLTLSNPVIKPVPPPGFKENIGMLISNLNRIHGLPTGYITAVTVDKFNHIWLGTKGFGLLKYDGTHLTIWNTSTGFPSDQIQTLYKDRKNRLWIGTTGSGLLMFDGKDFFHTSTSEGLHDNVITSFFQDRNGFIWASSNDGGVCMFSKELSQITILNSQNAFQSDNIRSITEDAEGNIWFASAGTGLYKYDFKKIFNYTTSNGIPDDIILSACCNPAGELWFGTDTKGIFFISRNDSVFGTSKESGLTDNCVTSVLSPDNSRVVAGTYEGGICIIEEKKIIHTITRQDGLSSNKIFSLHSPDRNTLIASGPDGINFIFPDRIFIFDENHGIQNAYIKSIGGYENKVFLASYGMGLLAIRNDSLFRIISPVIDNDNILSVHVDPNWNIWFSSENSKLYQISPDGKIKFYSFSELDNPYILSIYSDKENELWLGTDGNGLFRLLTNKKILYNYRYKDGLAGNIINHVNRCGKYLVVCAEDAGISLISDGKIQTITQEEHGLISKLFNAVSFHNNKIFLCTEGKGMVCIQTKNNDSIFQHTVTNKDFPTHIRSVVFDGSYMLMFSNVGLRIYYQSDSAEVWYPNFTLNQYDGLNNPEFLPGSVFEDKNQHVFSSTSSFLLKINKIVYKNKLMPDTPVVCGIWANGIPFSKYITEHSGPSLIKEYSNISDFLNMPERIVFSKSLGQLWIDISYRSWFPGQEEVELFYSFDPDNDSWLLSDNNKRITFSGLEPGLYRLSIKVKYSDQEFVRKNILEFQIPPPWWKTKWAQFLFTICILMVIVWVIRYRTHSLLKQKQQLEAIVKERTHKIEQQKELLEEKNKNILDSINYTQRLQNSSLPTEKDLLEVFPDSFILYKPKDIISGDFYFASFIRTNDGTILKSLVAGDCTGHGVPGAFLSILILAYIKQSLGEKNVNSPAEAMEFISSRMKKVLEYRKDESEVNDSADMAFLVVEPESNILTASCANNPVYIVRDKNLFEITPQKRSVGYCNTETPFTNQTFQLRKNDMVYLFSDGYADQFGKPILLEGKDKKFTRKKFKQLLVEISHLSVETQKKILWEKHLEWKANLEQTDDILVIGFRA